VLILVKATFANDKQCWVSRVERTYFCPEYAPVSLSNGENSRFRGFDEMFSIEERLPDY
jgi:hypothetical protein